MRRHSAVVWSPPPLSQQPPPGGRALDWGHRAPRRGGNQQNKECRIKTQTGDGQKFATVARAHGQAKQLGHKRANLNDTPPQAPECQCCHGPVVRRVANFCPEKARADDSAYCNNTEIGGALGAAVATKSRHWYLEKLRTFVVQQSP